MPFQPFYCLQVRIGKPLFLAQSMITLRPDSFLYTSVLTLLLVPLSIVAFADAEPALTESSEQWESIQGCFGCHDMSKEALSKQPRRQQKKHSKAMESQRACIDCHNATDVACCHDDLFPKLDLW